MSRNRPEVGVAVDDEGFADDETVEEEAMEVQNVNVDNEVDEVLNGPRATVYYSVQVAPSESEQGKDYTKDEVEELMKSEPYQRKIATCHLCGKSWYDGNFTEMCKECGGYPLKRPCPLCLGHCDRIWERDIKMSHAYHEAHWDGSCSLPLESQQAYAIRTLVDSSEDTLSEGLQDLSTS